ncbi:calcium-binding protein [Heterostelium album PN500]|uniref:Calcium-binding protein n=1 Tax=Heterostelium pallidum (strain ATCC 26659 / Pp 5 / PN500) TaxID=670386 RepID=D3BUQ4_HETP5|nr:calcium-binding protein [Heterostelium album PN500]EFA74842.1 calcium-binding protein [Heterostelium album PN500]|eukprot:XP_020426976.1 calcium-binding protein [Heterostelium album PN500]
MENLTDDQRQEFNTCFQQFDKDNDGRLNSKEAVMALKSIGVNIQENDVASGLDMNGFLGVVVKKLQITDPEDELRRAFNCFDQEGNGFISTDYLKQILMSMGDIMNAQEASDLCRECDTDNDGYISANDATKLILSKLQ